MLLWQLPTPLSSPASQRFHVLRGQGTGVIRPIYILEDGFELAPVPGTLNRLPEINPRRRPRSAL